MRFNTLSLAFLAFVSGCLNWNGPYIWEDTGVIEDDTAVETDTDTDTDTDSDSDSDSDSDTDTGPTCTDADNDGFAIEGAECGEIDCDDADSDAFPGNPEVCDDIDNDCNGSVDDGLTTYTYWQDHDGDGFGGTSMSVEDCLPPPGYVASTGDCNDDNADVFPGNPEVCDHEDNDCANGVDDGLATITWYADVDSDSFGDAFDSVEDCMAVPGYVDNSEDCNDADPNVNPDAEETCATDFDDNCNGSVDDVVDATDWWPDADEDGFGDALSSATAACSQPLGFVDDNSDCNDDNDNVNTDAVETCATAYDDNCDGVVEDGIDASTWYADADGDTYGDLSTFWTQCSQPADTVNNSLDCDDSRGDVNPDGIEICDPADVDEDCDGFTEEDDISVVGAVTWHEDADGDEFGNLFVSLFACDQPPGYVRDETDCDDTNEFINPDAQEVCDPQDTDEDCDGMVEEHDPSISGAQGWFEDADSDGYGNPLTIEDACAQPPGYVDIAGDCDDTDEFVNPDATEVCDPQDVDEDCNGFIDDADSGVTGQTAWYPDVDGDGHGDDTATPRVSCDPLTGEVTSGDDCDDTIALIAGGIGEACDDGVDNDCDGDIDTADVDAVCDISIECHDSGSWLDWKLSGPLTPYLDLPDVVEICFWAIDIDPSSPYNCDTFAGDGDVIQLTVPYSSLLITGTSSGGQSAVLDLWSAASWSSCPVTIDATGTGFYLQYP